MGVFGLKNKIAAYFKFGILFLAFISCKQIDNLLSFEIANESKVVINSSVPLNLPFNLLTPDISTNSSVQFENNNTDINHIKDIRLNKLTLTITNPSTVTFDLLKSIHVFISTNNLKEIELAYVDDIPANGTRSITLGVTQEKLDDYIKSSNINLRTSIVSRQLLTQDVEVKINSTFRVTADPK